MPAIKSKGTIHKRNFPSLGFDNHDAIFELKIIKRKNINMVKMINIIEDKTNVFLDSVSSFDTIMAVSYLKEPNIIKTIKMALTCSKVPKSSGE
jgi:hypothetical protein